MLQTLANESGIVSLYDHVEDEVFSGIVLSKLGKASLHDVTQGFRKQCPEGFAQNIISKVAKTLAKIHKKGVVHGNLNQLIIGLTTSKSAPGGYKFCKLGGFEHSSFTEVTRVVEEVHLR